MIAQFLQQVHPLPEEVLAEYLTHWTPHHAPRKTLLTSAGQIEKYLYFVQEGFQKSYYLHDGKAHVMAFTYPPSFSGIPESFLTQTPSHYFLETLTDSHFLRINYEKHQEMLTKHRPIETLFRKATEWVLIGMIHRHYEWMALDMESRFRAFAKRSPHLLNQLPHKDIASYLRIDATNFSKLIASVRI